MEIPEEWSFIRQVIIERYLVQRERGIKNPKEIATFLGHKSPRFVQKVIQEYKTKYEL